MHSPALLPSLLLSLPTLALPGQDTGVPGRAPESSPPPAWETRTLANGVLATVIHAPGAQRQILFTLLPHGMAADPAGRPQWSHLLEHMAIRSTDPVELRAPGMEFNGETSADAMRLDAYVEPGRFSEAVDRQLAWLEEWRTLAGADAEVLEREKGRIAGELATTVPRGYGHKWADAAWAQVAFHGAPHVRVAGVIEDATVEGLRSWRAASPTGFAGLRVVTVGPLEPREVWPPITSAFGELDTERGWTTPAPGTYLEGNLVLPTLNLEWQTGATRQTLGGLGEKLEGDVLGTLASECLAADRRMRLVLRPKDG